MKAIIVLFPFHPGLGQAIALDFKWVQSLRSSWCAAKNQYFCASFLSQIASQCFGFPAKQKLNFEIQQMAFFQLAPLSFWWTKGQQLMAKGHLLDFITKPPKLFCGAIIWQSTWTRTLRQSIVFRDAGKRRFSLEFWVFSLSFEFFLEFWVYFLSYEGKYLNVNGF